MLDFILVALATWRLSSLLVKEDGPGDILGKLRAKAGVKYDDFSRPYGNNVLAGILSCVWCCSVWVGFVTGVLLKPRNFADYLAKALALSSSAILIDEILLYIGQQHD